MLIKNNWVSSLFTDKTEIVKENKLTQHTPFILLGYVVREGGEGGDVILDIHVIRM